MSNIIVSTPVDTFMQSADQAGMQLSIQSAYNLGNQTSQVIPDLVNGIRQYCSITGDAAIVAPTGMAVECVSTLDLIIQYTNGITLSLQDIHVPTSSAVLFPVVLTPWKAYRIRLEYFSGYWQLVSFIGAFDETVD